MKGRKPQPVELKILRGNPGKRPIPTDTPRPVTDIPRCPSHLKNEARREWRRITRELADMGVLARADRAALEMYCVIYARWRTAEERLEADYQLVATTDKGYEHIGGYLVVANKCVQQMKALLTEFGATPSSRARVRVEKPKEEDSLADKLRRAVNG